MIRLGLLHSRKKERENPKEEDPPRRTTPNFGGCSFRGGFPEGFPQFLGSILGVVLQGVSTSSGFLVWEPPRESHAMWQRLAEAFVRTPLAKTHLCHLICTDPFAKPNLLHNGEGHGIHYGVATFANANSNNPPWKMKPAKIKLRITSASEQVFARISGRFWGTLVTQKHVSSFTRRRCEIYDCDASPDLEDIWTKNTSDINCDLGFFKVSIMLWKAWLRSLVNQHFLRTIERLFSERNVEGETSEVNV